MNILLVCKSLPHHYQGGIQTHTWQLAAHLKERGNQVTLLVAGSWKAKEKRYTLEGREIIELPYLPLRHAPFFPVFLEELSFNMAARNWISHHHAEYDIIHLQGRSGFMSLKQSIKTPFVNTFHGLIHLENSKSKINMNMAKRVHQFWASYFEKRSLRYSNACIAVSQEMLKSMVEVCPKATERCYVISNGVNTPENLEAVEHYNNLVFVGRLDAIKGLHCLLNAIPYFDDDIVVTIIGEGSERKSIEQRIQDEKWNNRVKLLGNLQNEQVLQEIQKSYALVLPSFYETQGIVLLEANANGKPVVATRVGGILEVVKDGYNGFLFEPNDSKALAEKVNLLFQNPDLAQIMGENGRQWVLQKYSWSSIAAATELVYTQILEQNKVNYSSKAELLVSFPQKYAEMLSA